MSDLVERLRSGEDGLEYAAADEIERLNAENEELYQIAFDLAMIDDNWPTEHDDMLLEDAIARAKEWWKKREKNES